MSSSLALLLCSTGIAGLFFLNRDRSAHTSSALWLPVIWLWIVGSRSASEWLGISPPAGADAQLDGSPFDRLVFQVLLAAGVVVLIRRWTRTRASLRATWPILLFFFYCLISVLWSDFPDITFKRWIKALGDLVMVLVVVTDGDPVAALRRLISRVGFILLPTSLVLIKYFGNLGRGYDPDGNPMNTGVTTNKNTLGLITFVVSLGALWQILTLLRNGDEPNRRRHLLAQGVLLAFGLVLLVLADSATAKACFALGAMLMLATNLPVVKNRPAAVHVLFLTIVLGGGVLMLFGGQAGLVHAMGRQSNFTGRTEIWRAVLPAVPNTVIGAGFESFWISSAVKKVWQNLSTWFNARGLNEAHNGYIEIYLNLGLLGVTLLALMLLTGYRRTIAYFRRDPGVGSLMLAYVVTAAVYSLTEAGYRMLSPMWIFLLLAIVTTSGVHSCENTDAEKPLDRPSHRVPKLKPNAAVRPVGRRV
jgi:exopolysaccharide production protein ExoQ